MFHGLHGYYKFIFIFSFLCIINAQDIKTLAVLDFDGFGINEYEAKTLTDRLRNQVVNIGTYRLIERGAMEEILKEQGFQQSGCSSNECIVEVGQLLGVQYMLGGTIGKVGNTFTVSMRIIDVETAAIIKTANYDMSGAIDDLLTVGIQEASELILLGEKKEPGSIRIFTRPSGAIIEISGEEIGKSPVSINDLPTGKELFISAYLVDHEPTIFPFTPNSGTNSPITLDLNHETGQISFTGTPNGSNIILGGKKAGKTPLGIMTKPTGEYSLIVSKPGFHKYRESFSLKANNTFPVSFTLKKKSKPLAVTFSTAIPGSGQLYLGYSKRGWLFLISAVATAYMSLDNYQQFSESKDQYVTDTDLYNNELDETMWATRKATAEASYSMMKDNEKSFLSSLGAFGTVWTISLLEVTF